MGISIDIQFHSEIYTAPRLAESLENSMSFGSSCLTNANLGHINSNNFNTSNSNGSTTINNAHLQQKHRIDALTTISTGSTTIPTTNTLSTSSLTQSMDSIVDSKLRQGLSKHFLATFNDFDFKLVIIFFISLL